MKRMILVAMSVDTDVDDRDLAAGVKARLDEFYPTDDGFPLVPEDVTVAVAGHLAYVTLLQAAHVGLDGATDAGVDPERADAAAAMLDGIDPWSEPEVPGDIPPTSPDYPATPGQEARHA
jgi:hypothetical protein